MATVEAELEFVANASDLYASEDLESIYMSIDLVEVREPLHIQITSITGS